MRVSSQLMVFNSHIDASSAVWTLIDNDKLGNQIARLAAIVVGISFFF